MREYHYIDKGGQQHGPVGLDTLRSLGLDSNTPVWYEGLSDWTTAGAVEELRGFLASDRQYQPYGGQSYGSRSQGTSYGQQHAGPRYAPGGAYPNDCPIKPDSYLAGSIICTVLTLFCGLYIATAFAVAGLVFASRVDSLWGQGRYDEAIEAAGKAKKFTMIGVYVGVGLIALGIMLVIGYMALGGMAASIAALSGL